MSVVTPSYTDNVAVIIPQALALGGRLRADLNLATKYGAFLFLRVGRTGGVALTNGVDLRVNRVPAGGLDDGAPYIALVTGAAAAQSSTINADAAAGADSITVAGGSWTAGEYALIRDAAGTFTRHEWKRIAKVAGTTLTFESPLRFPHSAAQADKVTSKAEVFSPIWVEGGSYYQVIADYSDDAAGDPVIVQVLAQTFDSNSME